ncbi:hypothetical protein EDM68_02975 [Candidatus Uhrbacteria bacterium]|nr:MAG: hypothetical protein EDM68_02975 [Candidatus Uhrbacteria bacterium]
MAAVQCECVITTQLRGQPPFTYDPQTMTGDSEAAIDGGSCQELRVRIVDQLIAGGGDVVDSNQELRNCREAPSAPAEPEAAPPAPRTPGEFGYVNPLGTVNLNVVLNRVIRTVLGFVGAIFLAMFVYGGATWMLAGGDAKKVESGRKALINAVIGMAIIALSYAIISVIFETAGRIGRG